MTPPVRYNIGDTTVYLSPVSRLDNETRRESERRTTRDIIRHVLGDEVQLDHNPSGAPCLIGSDLFLSVSHSLHFVVVAFSPICPIGVDIEEYRPQLNRVAPRVLSDSELSVYSRSDIDLLRAWTLKEALYKSALTQGLDFKRDIVLPHNALDTIAFVNNKPFEVSTIAILDNCLLSVACPVHISI